MLRTNRVGIHRSQPPPRIDYQQSTISVDCGVNPLHVDYWSAQQYQIGDYLFMYIGNHLFMWTVKCQSLITPRIVDRWLPFWHDCKMSIVDPRRIDDRGSPLHSNRKSPFHADYKVSIIDSTPTPTPKDRQNINQPQIDTKTTLAFLS